MPKSNLDISNATFLGLNGKKPVFSSDNAKHIFICGTTGSGKTVALSNYIKNCIDKDFPLLIVDGKGDTFENSILDIVHKLNINKKVHVINFTDIYSSDKYNPFLMLLQQLLKICLSI